MTTEQLKANVANLLKANVANLNARVIGLKLGDGCNRCGGCGEYSFNPMTGTRCFKCNGTGQTLSDTKAGWTRIQKRVAELPATAIDDYITDLRQKKQAEKASKKLMMEWRAACARIEMPDHHTKQNDSHSKFNAAIAPIYDKIVKLGYRKNSHLEILEALRVGMETIKAKEVELFG